MSYLETVTDDVVKAIQDGRAFQLSKRQTLRACGLMVGPASGKELVLWGFQFINFDTAPAAAIEHRLFFASVTTTWTDASALLINMKRDAPAFTGTAWAWDSTIAPTIDVTVLDLDIGGNVSIRPEDVALASIEMWGNTLHIKDMDTAGRQQLMVTDPHFRLVVPNGDYVGIYSRWGANELRMHRLYFYER